MLLRSGDGTYKRGMHIRFLPIVAGLSLIAAFLTPVVASDFNGEVLVAPPPPNWTGGTPIQTPNGIEQVWRRNGNGADGVAERVTIRRGLPGADSDPSARVQRWIDSFTEKCVETTSSTVSSAKTSVGRTAQASAVCQRNADRVRHGRVMVLVGEFSSYQVVRSWSGAKGDPGNPRDSQKMATIWDDYFGRISLCNTLTDPCDPATAAAIHAHPRFKEMRSLETAERPILPADQVRLGAGAFGTLTGQAEACGEDVSPLLLRIGRMLAHVSANDADASAAGRHFDDARQNARVPSGAARDEACGEIRRQFREHPSRVQGFARYILGLI